MGARRSFLHWRKRIRHTDLSGLQVTICGTFCKSDPCDQTQEKMWAYLVTDAYELRRRIEDGDVDSKLRNFFGKPPAAREFATPAVVKNEVLADVNGNMWLDQNFWRQLSAADTCPIRITGFEAISCRLASKQEVPYRNWISDWPKARELMVGVWVDHLRRRCE